MTQSPSTVRGITVFSIPARSRSAQIRRR